MIHREVHSFTVDTLVVVAPGERVTVFGQGAVPAAGDILVLRMSPPRWRVFEVAEATRREECRARRARRRRLPIPVADPTLQIEFGFPEVEAPPVRHLPHRLKMQDRPLIEKLMRSWLRDGRPSPIRSFIRTGRRGQIAWAFVRLFDGGHAVVRFEDVNAVGMSPRLQYHGLNIYYIVALGRWVRAEDDEVE